MNRPIFFPSTITARQRATNQKRPDLEYTLGVPSKRTPAENYKRNMQLMHAIAAANNAEFYGLVQPIGSLAKHKNKVVELYGKIAALPNELPFVRDATSILDGYDDVFAEGGDPPVHLTQKGDRIVAEYVFRSIEPSITKILASAPDQ